MAARDLCCPFYREKRFFHRRINNTPYIQNIRINFWSCGSRAGSRASHPNVIDSEWTSIVILLEVRIKMKCDEINCYETTKIRLYRSGDPEFVGNRYSASDNKCAPEAGTRPIFKYTLQYTPYCCNVNASLFFSVLCTNFTDLGMI